MPRQQAKKKSTARIEELERRLQHAEETLQALRSGQVDAIVVTGPQGEQVYTLEGADRTFRVAIETMSEGAASLSPQGAILYSNPRLAEMLGEPLERIRGASLRQFIPNSEQPLFDALLAEGLAGHAQGELRLIAAEGKRIPVYVSLTVLPMDDLTAVTLIVSDLTERKRAEEALAAERLARSILVQAAEAIVVCDLSGLILQASDAAAHLCGRNPLRQRFEEMFPLDFTLTAARPQPESALPAMILRGESLSNQEADLVRPGQPPRHLLVSGRPLRDAHHRIVGCTLILNDITGRKSAEGTMRRLNQDLGRQTQQLDAANQELHVANEELAAANEELLTANDRLAAEIARRAQAEEQLRRQEEWLRVTLSSIGDGVIATDAAGRVTFINPVAALLTGWSMSEALGQPCAHVFSIIDEKTRAPAEDIAARVLRDKRLVALANHTALATRTGREVPIEDSAAPILDEHGNLLGAVIVFYDVTARRRAQEAVQASEHRTQEILASIGDGFWAVDREWRFIYANPRAAHNIGLEPADVIGKNLWDLFPSIFHTPHEHHYRKVMAERSPAHFEIGGVLSERAYSISVYPMGDGISVYWREITERKRMEEALRQSEQKANDLVRYAGTAIYEIDFRGPRFKSVNDAMCQMSGYTREELLATSPFRLLDEPSRVLFRERIQRVLAGEPVDEEVEYNVITKDGRERYAILNTTPAYENGNPVGAFVIAHDITERKEVEREREALLTREQAARRQAEAAVQVRDTFISVASHELKTPLTSIKGYAELLAQRGRQADLDPQLLRMADTIDKQTTRLEKLIAAILDISRLERGQLRLELETVDLTELLERIVREVEPTLRVHRIAFISDVRRVRLEADAARLEQVMENLIQNAIKYSPHGGPVTVQLTQEPTRMCIAITDRGIGIPHAAQPHLFKQFYRAANAEAYRIGGLGVGLYVSREIVRLHGGDIEVQSEEGQGSTFTVRLPLPPNY